MLTHTHTHTHKLTYTANELTDSTKVVGNERFAADSLYHVLRPVSQIVSKQWVNLSLGKTRVEDSIPRPKVRSKT